MREPRIVCIGGGHGLSAALRAARQLTPWVTAVVTVADDGGSSGILRSQLGIAPPGDLRMALAALGADEGRSALLQYRFREGELAGHPLGNLLIAALADIHGDLVAALHEVAVLAGARGRVLPVSRRALTLKARVGEKTMTGQVAIATSGGPIAQVWVEPDEPALEDALDAVAGADLVLLGPGSLYTSVLATLVVGDLAAAVSSAPRAVYIMNLREQPGETPGMAPRDYLRALQEHCPGLRPAAILAHAGKANGPKPLIVDPAEFAPTPVVEADLASGGVHDPDRLAAALKSLL